MISSENFHFGSNVDNYGLIALKLYVMTETTKFYSLDDLDFHSSSQFCEKSKSFAHIFLRNS